MSRADAQRIIHRAKELAHLGGIAVAERIKGEFGLSDHQAYAVGGWVEQHPTEGPNCHRRATD